jgi:hypothetical protein
VGIPYGAVAPDPTLGEGPSIAIKMWDVKGFAQVGSAKDPTAPAVKITAVLLFVTAAELPSKGRIGRLAGFSAQPESGKDAPEVEKIPQLFSVTPGFPRFGELMILPRDGFCNAYALGAIFFSSA